MIYKTLTTLCRLIAKMKMLVDLLLLLTYVAGAHGQNLSFLEEPRSQAILTGNTASFVCASTNSKEAYWFIDSKFVAHGDIYWNRYSQKHPEFNFSGTTQNLYLSIEGNNNTNGTTVYCHIHRDTDNVKSRTATLHVFDFFVPPPQPILSVQAINESLQLMITEPYQWLDYEESAFNISLMGTNLSASILLQTRDNAPFVIGLNEMISVFPLEPCSYYWLHVTAVSPAFGMSEPSELEFIFPKQEMLEFGEINGKIYYNAMVKPFLFFQAQVNHMCSLLNYTFTVHIQELNNSLSWRIGPKKMSESGIINEMLTSELESNKQYSVHMDVNYQEFEIIPRSIVSEDITIDTSFNRDLICPETEGQVTPNTVLPAQTDNNIVVALIIFCVILALTLAAFITACICFLWRQKSARKRTSYATTEQPMVSNPIYSGPVYETVPQGYNPLCSSASTTPDSSPTTPLSGIHYTPNPTSRADILELVQKSTIPSQTNERLPSPLTRTSYRSSSVSSNSTIKKPQRERNKLHLTLSLGMDGNGMDINGSAKDRATESIVRSEDTNYTIMSPATPRKFDTSLSEGWGESPEATSKYQE